MPCCSGDYVVSNATEVSGVMADVWREVNAMLPFKKENPQTRKLVGALQGNGQLSCAAGDPARPVLRGAGELLCNGGGGGAYEEQP